MRAGRDFTSQDTRDNTLVTIVNETLARTMWPGENPLGKRFACCEVGPKGRMDPVWHEVVGVVADGKYEDLDEAPRPFLYYPLSQNYQGAIDVIARTSGDPRLWLQPFAQSLRGLGLKIMIQPGSAWLG